MVQSATMVHETAPEHPAYRTSLFFGPELVDARPAVRYCVFNVKKRSWKGGIQVAVEIASEQVDRIRRTLRFPSELARIFESLPVEERALYEQRAEDLFVQALCSSKLDLLLESGVSQDNQSLTAEALVEELDRAASARRSSILSFIVSELDLTPGKPASPAG